jgi:hypothetical protein
MPSEAEESAPIRVYLYAMFTPNKDFDMAMASEATRATEKHDCTHRQMWVAPEVFPCTEEVMSCDRHKATPILAGAGRSSRPVYHGEC